MRPAAVILAAGKGTRMRSSLAKALQPVCGRPMVELLIRRAKEAGASQVVVIAGHGIDLVKKSLAAGARNGRDRSVQVVHQKKQLGSGHAVMQAARALAGHSGPVLVLYCDTPLIKAETLRSLLDNHHAHDTGCTLLSVDSEAPKGYGRVVRDAGGRVERIVEENDAGEDEKAIREINVGCYVFDPKKLFSALRRIGRDTAKKEYYLTDVVGILAREARVAAVKTDDREEVLGVNTLSELARIREIAQRRICEGWMARGVAIRDPKTTYIDSDVRIGQDTVLLPQTVLEEASQIGPGCVIGPFARIRGASRIGSQSVIGNFVEIVRSQIGSRTQVKHLSYLGDARIGDGVNIGAGTITANYDGKEKHRTVIGDGAQIGSGTVFVAPVTVGNKARTGAGAVVTRGTRVKEGSVYVGVPAKELKRK